MINNMNMYSKFENNLFITINDAIKYLKKLKSKDQELSLIYV